MSSFFLTSNFFLMLSFFLMSSFFLTSSFFLMLSFLMMSWIEYFKSLCKTASSCFSIMTYIWYVDSNNLLRYESSSLMHTVFWIFTVMYVISLLSFQSLTKYDSQSIFVNASIYYFIWDKRHCWIKLFRSLIWTLIIENWAQFI